MRNLFLSPHSDDETLFGAFTILKHKPLVVICFPSTRDYGETSRRLLESERACGELSTWCQMIDIKVGIDEALKALDVAKVPDIVWAPNVGASHPDHRDLSFAAHRVFKDRVRHYDTYVLEADGRPRKVRTLPPAPIDHPEWVHAKLSALACYRSQLEHPRASQFFLADLFEYAEQP